MDYFHLLLDLPAVVGGSTMASLLSPWKVQARAVPALLFVVALIVMALPMLPVVALALMLPAAWIQRLLGIELHGHEPVNISPAVEKARSAARTARERLRTPEPVDITAYATHAYPAPGDAAEAAQADASDAAEDAPGDGSTATTAATPPSPADAIRQKLEETMNDPRLPAGAQQRLLQRPGATSHGLRNQHAPTRRSSRR